MNALDSLVRCCHFDRERNEIGRLLRLRRCHRARSKAGGIMCREHRERCMRSYQARGGKSKSEGTTTH